MHLRVVYTTAALVAIVLAMQLLAPPAVAQEAGAKSEIQQPVSTAPVDSSATQESEIDAPSAVRRNQAEAASQTAPANFELAQVQMKNEGSGASQEVVQSAPQQPQGAAAARIQPATGTAASKPAGAAIAPAKQRRVRTFLIRLAPLAGAGVALATVFALSSARPSRPPGTH